MRVEVTIARSRRAQLTELYRALDAAESYAEWHEVATAHDALTGAVAWREEDHTSHLDAIQVRRDIRQLRALREAGRPLAVASLLQETLYRHGSDLADADLYGVALAGTKHVVDDFLDEVVAAIAWLAAAEEIPKPQRVEGFQTAAKVYGRTALMLSGGATLGFHHLGVVKGLFELGLLPSILSGASTGAMVAAGCCARTDDELAHMFADTDVLRLDGLSLIGPVAWLREGAMLDAGRLEEVLLHNIGAATFAEAHAHTGRTLNISVSPTRLRQKPRLLTHLTAPEVTLVSAVMASSALPGLFPPVELRQRAADATAAPHLPGERWVDGSIYEDLPKLRLARLHNVNHFIVSQTNPHVLPFVHHHGQRGVRPALAGLTSAAIRSYGAYATDVTRRAARWAPGGVRQAAEQAYALVSQDYRGDIDLHPRFHWRLYRKVVSNPTRADLADFIREGQRSVWPKVAQIRDQVRVRTALDAAVRSLL